VTLWRGRIDRRRIGAALLVGVGVVGLAACGSSSKKSTTTTASAPPAHVVATTWGLPGADLQNTRMVAGAINSSNVSKLHVAWTVPIKAAGSFGTYATTPVVSNGVVYTQDINSNVYAISLKTGKVKWFKSYNSPDVGPNGVTVQNGVVYGATETAAFALQASTGEQLWQKKLVRNPNEGIDMAPGINNGTVYISTVPGNGKAFYKGNGQAILWAMNAKTGAVKWKWDEVPTNLWSNKFTKVNSGGGQWDPPSFDANGDVYVGVSNPAPFPGIKGHPFASTRPGPDLYTSSIVKLNHTNGKLDWYYQAVPHDIYDWDMENSPILTTANGKAVVIDAGKMGIVYEVDESTGKLLWKTPVGVHNGHDNDDLLALKGKLKETYPYKVYPGELGGVESQLASNGKTVFVAMNDLPGIVKNEYTEALANFTTGKGELVALDQATGKIRWQHHFKTSPYGAATISNDVVFTTTFDGTVWGLSTKTGKVLWSAKLPAGTNAPVAVTGDTVIAAGSFPLGKGQKAEIVAYSLSAPAASAGTTTTAAGSGGSTSQATAGKTIFKSNCATCHTLADAGASGSVGPNLDQLKPSKATVVHQVTNGGGGMPSFSGQLSKTQIQSVAAYVSSVAGKKGTNTGSAGGTP
jgi:outer membrane protein assembly factor BamB/cytochrome c553